MTEELQVSGTEVAGLFNARSEDTLTNDDRNRLIALLTQDDRVDLAIPDEMDPRELWRTLEICSRVFVRVRRASGQLKLLIGRALLVIQKTPEVYKSRGFSSFDEFMTDEARGLPSFTGISRAELYKAKTVAQSVGPDMSLEDAREVGFTKMQLIAGANMEPAEQKQYIEDAKTMTIPQLREKIAKSDLNIDADDLEYDLIQVPATKAQKKLFQEFTSNPQVRAYCGTDSPATILERAIQEAEAEWIARAVTIEGSAVPV